jgi:DNA-binding transcriptional ArsR family regulator
MDDWLSTVTGSVTRAYSLAILAGTRVPQTAYRIAKLGGLSPPNVYVELRRLAANGIVSKQGGGWVLVNDRVRTLCEGQGPLNRMRSSLEDKRTWFRENGRRMARIRTKPVPARPAWNGREPGIMRQFSRSPTKNGLLRAAGLRESRHRAR